jgi:hypothetical protein
MEAPPTDISSSPNSRGMSWESSSESLTLDLLATNAGVVHPTNRNRLERP